MTRDADIILVLFDIDGTLLDVRGAGRQAFAQTLHKVFGWNDGFEWVRFDGGTDLDILCKALARRNLVYTKGDIDRFFQQLPVELEDTISRSDVRMHPGVRELLERLAQEPNIRTGLVTGNIESCARIKLKKFNLNSHFPLGAYGHEHADRSQIAGLALMRARQQLQKGQRIAARFLVGDTPFDIAAAAAIGGRAIAVTTGAFDRAALEQAGADHVLDNLSDTESVLKIILRPE